jgi:hypothetical protein
MVESIVPGGRFKATEEERGIVKLLSAASLPHEQICHCVHRHGRPIALKTLTKHFKIELQTSRSEMNKIVLGRLMKAIVNDAPWAIQLYLKQRMHQYGWRDPVSQSAIGVAAYGQSAPEADGSPLNLLVQFEPSDPSKKPMLLGGDDPRPMSNSERDALDMSNIIDAKPMPNADPAPGYHDDVPTYDAGGPSVRAGKTKSGKRYTSVDWSDPSQLADRPPGTKSWMGR